MECTLFPVVIFQLDVLSAIDIILFLKGKLWPFLERYITEFNVCVQINVLSLKSRNEKSLIGSRGSTGSIRRNPFFIRDMGFLYHSN